MVRLSARGGLFGWNYSDSLEDTKISVERLRQRPSARAPICGYQMAPTGLE